MTATELLATNNAFFNAASGVCLVLGLRAIRAKQPRVHRRWMLTALVCSTLFLVSYLTRVALFPSRPFPGHGPIRAVYFTILFSHMILAMTVPPMALRAVWLSEFARRFADHRKLARVLFPIWLYVSVTGVVVYLLLFHYPA